jgi:hypothetical protein
VCLGAVLVAGCGGGSRLPEGETGTVSGRITYMGKPAPEGSSVVFLHKESGATAFGQLDSDGGYTLQMRGGDDILVGDYDVGISPPTNDQTAGITDEQAMEMSVASEIPTVVEHKEIPERYRTPETSEQIFGIKAGANTYDLDMKE